MKRREEGCAEVDTEGVVKFTGWVPTDCQVPISRLGPNWSTDTLATVNWAQREAREVELGNAECGRIRGA